MSSGTIKVSLAGVGEAVSGLSRIGQDLGADAREFGAAGDALSSAWTGEGSASFAVAAETLREYLSAASGAIASESASLEKARSAYASEDESLAAALSGTR